jgi:hypothetical protein
VKQFVFFTHEISKQLLDNKTNGTFFPVFTSPEEAKKLQYDKPFQSFAMRFQDIAALTEQTPKVQGFVVNPFGENLPFTQEMLESIKQTLIRVAKERKAAKEAAENGEAPNIAVTNNETAE